MAKRRYEDQPGFNPRTMGNRHGPVPAGPAGPIGKPKSRKQIIAAWYAAHDRPAPQITFTSGVPRRAIPSQRAYPVSRRTSS